MTTLPYQTQTSRPHAERWQRYWRLITRRWWILLLLVSISVCYRAYQLRQQPVEYSSSAKLVLQGRIQLSKSSTYQEEMSHLFGTQKNILEGRNLRARVKDQLSLTHPDLKPSSVRLFVEREQMSGVINLRARGQSGPYTQAYLDSVLDNYMAIRSEMRASVSGQTLSAITEQLNRLSEKIEEEEHALTEYRNKHDLILAKEGQNKAAEYLDRLMDKRASLETRLSFIRKLDVEQDINRRSQLISAPMTLADDGHATPHDSLAGSERDFLRTKREIAMLEVELNRMSQVMKPKHPKIRSLNARIANLKALLNVFRQESETLNTERARALEVELENLNQEIAAWEAKTSEMQRLLAESQRLQEKLNRTRTNHKELLLRMHEVDQARSLDQDNFTVMERASAPSKAHQDSRKPLISAALLGLVAGAGILLLINHFDDRLHSSTEYFERFAYDFLGSIPEISRDESQRLVSADDERPFFAESYRKLRSSILYKKWDGTRPSTILVTSAIPFDGKSTVASNLATVFAMSGSKVLLIDGDLRRGALHDRFGQRNDKGLSEVLTGHCELADVIVPTGHGLLDLLPRGQASIDTVEAFLRHSTREMFQRLDAVYDYVVIDSAPVLVADDTLSLAPLADTTLFVIRLDRTPARLAEKALTNLEQRQVTVGGVILNFDHAYIGEYYAYDYSKYYAKVGETT